LESPPTVVRTIGLWSGGPCIMSFMVSSG
jgi:hypothetical protein